MIIYGRNPVHEALRGPRTVQNIWTTAEAAKEAWLRAAGVAPTIVSGSAIEQRCGSSGHQGVCALVSEFSYAEAGLLLGQGGLIIALDQVQDPQNLGSICRSAECVGAAGLVVTERRAAAVTPAVCKASAGAVEHLSVARVRNLTDFLNAAKARGYWCYGADGSAETDYRQVDFSGPVVLVLGSEGSGLRPRVAAACDLLVALPLRGRTESLSVAAAAAVLLYTAAAAPQR
ncbi:MAG: 23S rRNA (guanosine(2251)-2'-O)-methyltransferase RlmB [Solirubrobacteraceae bacterium]